MDSPAPFVATVALAGALGYLIGSISSGYLVGKAYRNVDLREVGSGSTGATNTYRALGPGAALLVALLDILKGAGAAWLGGALFAAGVTATDDVHRLAQAAAGAAAVIGHCWPITLRGRGGRGVATGFGAFLLVASPAWLISVVAFILAIALTRIVSVGSLAAATTGVLGYAVLTVSGVMRWDTFAFLFVIVTAAVIVVRHRQNIARIVRGVEPRLGRP